MKRRQRFPQTKLCARGKLPPRLEANPCQSHSEWPFGGMTGCARWNKVGLQDVDFGRRCGDVKMIVGACAYDGERTSGSRCDTVKVTKVLCMESDGGSR